MNPVRNSPPHRPSGRTRAGEISNEVKKVVRIGGGSGGFTLLRGLKEFPLDITAVFTSFDSGGSAGILRDELGVLPPGDVRRGLLALADEKQAEILRELLNFRFENPARPNGIGRSGGGNSSLHGHSFGNLFLVALASIYGGEIEGIQKASELLNIKGKIFPVSLEQSQVHAILEDGTEIVGETNVDIPKHDGNLRIKNVFLDPPARIYEGTDKAIRKADLIVIGPGDLYSSIVPTLLTTGMKEALQASRGKTIVVCNLMTKWGETNDFTASDMVRELLHYSGLSRFDYAICNTKEIDKSLAESYARENKHPMRCDSALSQYVTKVITGDFFLAADIARHDSEKLARVISEL